MNSVADFVKALGPSRLAAMGAVAVGLIGFFIFIAFRLAQPQMSVLFTDLPFEDSTVVVRRLEALNVNHELRQDGAVVLVPRKDVLKIRMRLAEDGIPAGGTVGYEIFDKSDTLGATSFVQNINQLRATEGELARTIRSLRQVQLARVHLVLPKRKLFSREKAEPSASIVVKVRGVLSGGQIRAIQHLTASAVEGLKPGKISIINEKGKLLASGREDGDFGIDFDAADEKKLAFENRIRKQVEDIVNSIVGTGHSRVQVNAELDLSSSEQVAEVYDPEGQVVRSQTTVNQQSSSNQTNNDGAVTVGNELPSAGADGGAEGKSAENENRSEETINYALSKTQKTLRVGAGGVKKLSVAVLVDGLYRKADDGTVAYSPRSKEELEEIDRLVRSAVGFDKTRGDVVQISNLRFADQENQLLGNAEEASMFNFSKDDYFYIAELVVTLIIALFVLLFVVRPLVRRILDPDADKRKELLTADGVPIQIDPETGEPIPMIANGTDGEMSQEELAAIEEQNNRTASMIEDARLTGEVHAAAIKEIGEIILNNPQESVAVIRDWMDADPI